MTQQEYIAVVYLGRGREITVSNHGPLILSTNYWDSDLARTGKVFVSVNAGAIRVLLPPAAYGCLSDMREDIFSDFLAVNAFFT